VHPQYFLGGSFPNISVYNGQQYGFDLAISQVRNACMHLSPSHLRTFVDVNMQLYIYEKMELINICLSSIYRINQLEIGG